MHPVSGSGNDVGASLRELRQYGVAVRVGNVRGIAAANKEGRVWPGGYGLPAHNIVVLVPEHRHVKTPLPVNKRLQQELNDAFFIKMHTHDGSRLLARRDTRFCDRILFIADGGIAEEGTHKELLAKGGAYAELFAVQSRYYQEGGVQDEEDS